MNQLVYSEIETAITTIEDLTNTVEKALKEMSSLINDNVDKPGVWKGERSSKDFLKDWQTFENDFPTFVNTFRKQSSNVRITLENLRAQDI